LEVTRGHPIAGETRHRSASAADIEQAARRMRRAGGKLGPDEAAIFAVLLPFHLDRALIERFHAHASFFEPKCSRSTSESEPVMWQPVS
jgi:hypothetical protein